MVNLQNTVQNQLDSKNGVVMADNRQVSSVPITEEIVNKKERTLSQIIDAASPSSQSDIPWFEKYNWRIGNDLDESATVKEKKYNDSSSSSVKSEKTVVRPIDKVNSKSAKVGARKVLKAATSTTAKKFVKKVAKKGVEKAFEAVSEYAVNKIDSLGKNAINRGFSPKLVQNVSSAVKRGAHSGLSNLSNTTVNMMHADDDLGESATVKRRKNNVDYSSSVKAESVKTVTPNWSSYVFGCT